MSLFIRPILSRLEGVHFGGIIGWGIRKVALFLALGSVVTSAQGQEQFGGYPKGIALARKSCVATRDICTASSDLNLEDLRSQIQWQAHSDGGLLTVGRYIPIDAEKASWQYRQEENIWQLELAFEGASALSVSYQHCIIPEGASLYIYDISGRHILGAYTHQSTPKDGAEFATSMLPSDRIVLEYQPSSRGEAPQILPQSLGVVAVPMRSLYASYQEGYDWAGEDNSGTCMVNVNCSEGDAWRNEQNSIAFIQTKVKDQLAVCSGTLLNNTQNDGTPYLITAAHCAGSKTLQASSADLFAGWDRTASAPTSGVGLHHPLGDATKISTFTQNLQSPLGTRIAKKRLTSTCSMPLRNMDIRSPKKDRADRACFPNRITWWKHSLGATLLAYI